MARLRLNIPSASTGKTLVLFGVALAGAFITSSRLLLVSGLGRGPLWTIFDSPISGLLILLVATVAATVGTMSLIRPSTNGSEPIKVHDIAFVIVGLVATGIGTWICGSLSLSLLLER